ncbi:MAG: DUF1801 domain-containing protein [Anaeromyxobacteraceae bacterium]
MATRTKPSRSKAAPRQRSAAVKKRSTPSAGAGREASVEDGLDALEDPQTARDSRALMQLMRRISGGARPKVWNVGTIGFDAYHFKYDSGREGDGHALGFYPRDAKLTVYLMDGTARHAANLARLGEHTTSRVCVYLKRLDDVRLPVLEEILEASYAYLKAQDGRMHRVD